MTRFPLVKWWLVGAAMLSARLVAAQSFVLDLPLKSQKAQVSQTIGLTEITIAYHRPLANGRQLWDSLVPYGQVWRAGANINTTIAVSDPVTVDGRPLGPGTYGLHMIPRPGAWTIIFSKNATSWGSFTYDSSEDALRITVTPTKTERHDALTYEFDDPRAASTVVAMTWDTVRVAFTIAIDAHRLVRESINRQLRTLARYTWISWNDAATYLLTEQIDLDTALAYADHSIKVEDRFDNELTKSKILTALARPAEAAAARQRALDRASPEEANDLARDLLASRRTDDALALFQTNAARHPDLWFVHDGLARAYSAAGKFRDAVREMNAAVAIAPATEKKQLAALVARLAANQDINQ
jgi:tetratricopeptide (TPR) repeat protein